MIQVASMKKIFMVLLILLVLLPASVCADNFERLRRDSSRISTISADFVQKKFMKILSKPLVSEGKFYYTAPDSIRWEYSKPIKSVVISDKGNTKRYIASGGKMVEDKTGGAQAMKIVLDEVAGWMSGKFTSNPSFISTLKEGSNTQITLTPVGKSMAGMIEKIEITVSRKDASIKSVRIVESATAETRIDFQHVVINQEIQPSVFQDVQ
ncbi:MAG: outer membrane lipoprotein carrier protein LolA [Deltaproteobacteria bacterium]|nr:MAG: outer membrane lipoprotein carrier protein LolA [Deltaproteobacteria bacterium]